MRAFRVATAAGRAVRFRRPSSLPVGESHGFGRFLGGTVADAAGFELCDLFTCGEDVIPLDVGDEERGAADLERMIDLRTW